MTSYCYPEIIDEPFFPGDSPPEFNDPGGEVTDDLLCAALDLIVWCDDEDDDLYDAKREQVIDQYQAAEMVIARFAEQMQPASHGQMLQEFDRITTCDRYSHSILATATVRSALNYGWSGIGPWRA